MFAVGIEGFGTIGTVVQAGFAFGMLNRYGWRLLVVVSTIPYGAHALTCSTHQLLWCGGRTRMGGTTTWSSWQQMRAERRQLSKTSEQEAYSAGCICSQMLVFGLASQPSAQQS